MRNLVDLSESAEEQRSLERAGRERRAGLVIRHGHEHWRGHSVPEPDGKRNAVSVLEEDAGTGLLLVEHSIARVFRVFRFGDGMSS